MSRFTSFIKNCLYLLVFLLVAPQIATALYKQYTLYVTPNTKVGIIAFNRPLMNSSEYIRNLKTFFKDPSIKAIMFRMECPGGAAGTSQAIYNELTYLKQQYPHKPVVAVVENMCASGGYYIASPCDWIVSNGAAFIGSIGVYIAVPRVKEFINNYKIEYPIIKSGKYKSALNPLAAKSEETDKLIQGLCDDTYQQFIEDVAKSRPALNLKDADIWAQGKIFTGKQALELKLIDQLGSYAHAENKLRELAHIPAHDEIQWVKAKQQNVIMRLLAPDESGESNDEVSISQILSNAFGYWMQEQAVIQA